MSEEKEPTVYIFDCSDQHCDNSITEFNSRACQFCDAVYCLSCAEDNFQKCCTCGTVACVECLIKDGLDWFCSQDCRVEKKGEKAKTTGNVRDLRSYMSARRTLLDMRSSYDG